MFGFVCHCAVFRNKPHAFRNATIANFTRICIQNTETNAQFSSFEPEIYRKRKRQIQKPNFLILSLNVYYTDEVRAFVQTTFPNEMIWNRKCCRNWGEKKLQMAKCTGINIYTLSSIVSRRRERQSALMQYTKQVNKPRIVEWNRKISHLLCASHVHCGALFCHDCKVHILHKINDVVLKMVTIRDKVRQRLNE